MLTGSYHKRLKVDLARWVGEGLVSADSAAAIRRSLDSQGGFRLPGLLGLFGGLLIASSVAAFVAANWEEMPRLLKLGMILAGILTALLYGARLQRQGSPLGAEAAATCAVLIFAAGVALVGQMYHLPTDWPGGALLIACGALAVALLQRSDGALMLAFIAIAVWSGGRWSEAQGALHLPFLLLYLPALWLALSRGNRAVHHLAVLALMGWLALLPGQGLFLRFDFGLIAYGLAVSVAFVALGALALDRGWPALLTAFLSWGLIGLQLCVGVELFRILDRESARAGAAGLMVYLAYGAALPLTLALTRLAGDRRFAWPLAVALLLSLLIPLVFWSGAASSLLGKVVVAGLILVVAMALVVAGSAGGVRRMLLAGAGLFGIAVLILLWQTVGTLLSQSLFFLVAGLALLVLARMTRRLLARFAAPIEAQP